MEGLVLVWLQLVGLVLVLVVGVVVWESPSIGHRVMGYGGGTHDPSFGNPVHRSCHTPRIKWYDKYGINVDQSHEAL